MNTRTRRPHPARTTRAYSMVVRGAKAADTRARIRQAAIVLHAERLWDDFTLEEVARRAGTTVQTVLRCYGSKDALSLLAMEASTAPRREPCTPGDVRGAIRVLYDDYERIGDQVIRYVADEHRHPALAHPVALGRKGHRSWTEAAFAPQLRARSGASRDRLLHALLVATDVYVWKILRRDLHLGREHAQAVVLDIIGGVIQRGSHGPISVGVLGRGRKPATQSRNCTGTARARP